MATNVVSGGRPKGWTGHRAVDQEVADQRGIQLSEGIGPPGQDLAGRGQGQAVGGAGGDAGDGGSRGQAHRHHRPTVHGGAVTQLARGVEPPGVDLAGGGEGQAVPGAGGDGGEGDPAGRGHRHRRMARDGGAVTDLPVDVGTPGVDLAGGGEGQAVVAPGGDGRHRHTGGHRHQHRAFRIRRGSVAQLTEQVGAPGVDLAGGGEGQAVCGPGGHRHHRPSGNGDRLWGGGLVERADAQLPGKISTPGIDLVVDGEAEGVGAAGGYRVEGGAPWLCDHARYRHRGRSALTGGPVGQLTPVVAAPGVEGLGGKARRVVIGNRLGGRQAGVGTAGR